METRSLLNSWLLETGRRARAKLRLDGEGRVSFAYDGRLPITLAAPERGGRFVLYATVLPLAGLRGELLEAVALEALRGNLPLEMESGGMPPDMSLASDGEHLYLIARPSMQALNVAGFQTLLEHFLVRAETTASALRDYIRAREARDGDPDEKRAARPGADPASDAFRGPRELWG